MIAIFLMKATQKAKPNKGKSELQASTDSKEGGVQETPAKPKRGFKRPHPELERIIGLVNLLPPDAPAKLEVVIVNGDPNPNRPDLPHYGAGETMCKPMLAAVANAVFDATGVRLRRVPFRDARVLAALKAANV